MPLRRFALIWTTSNFGLGLVLGLILTRHP